MNAKPLRGVAMTAARPLYFDGRFNMTIGNTRQFTNHQIASNFVPVARGVSHRLRPTLHQCILRRTTLRARPRTREGCMLGPVDLADWDYGEDDALRAEI